VFITTRRTAVKHLLATLAVGFSTALVVLGAATPAGAGGQAGFGCSPGFDVGAVTWEQYRDLPRNQAGLAAGQYSMEDLRNDKFVPTDHNGDGLICVKDVAASVGGGATHIWQYFYDIVDNNASVPTG
jgi:hypothetical protein